MSRCSRDSMIAMKLPLGLAWVIAIVGTGFPQEADAQLPNTNGAPVLQLEVDARDAPVRLLHVHLTMPVSPGPIILRYPKWIPGEHGPTGPISDIANLRFQSNLGQLEWRRDPIDLFLFHLTVPSGGTKLEANFDFISPSEAGGFSSGSSITTQLAVISWNQLLLYPEGLAADQLLYRATLRLPRGWKYGTALNVVREDASSIDFRTVSLTTLVDSPVAAGLHVRVVDLGTVDGAAHDLHITADSEKALAITDELIEKYKHLVKEAGTLFGTRHYRNYHFLLTLSDHVASFGLEHHESSDDRLAERYLLDENLQRLHADLLAHEFVHSWNGKYRRPSGLVTKAYGEPMQGDLLWVYEGLTEYLGAVLATRSGLQTPEQWRDNLANSGGRLTFESGRSWRPLVDTAISAQVLYGAREDYAGLRRGVDFYSEASLVWLEVDALLRQLSGGKKSIDDFCKVFYAGSNGIPGVKPYTRDVLVEALQSVQVYDWTGFFRERVDTVEKRAPLAGVENSGWKMNYDAKRSELWVADEDERKVASLEMSLGAVIKTDGLVQDVVMGGAAQKAGIAPGGQISAVNGRQFSLQNLREAVQAATTSGVGIEVSVKNGEYYSTHQVNYHGGEKYPHLTRDAGKADLLSLIGAPVAAKAP